ncbi:MAG: hypothetical protein QXR19_02795 [Candidatus Jordarchaeaceae archaeon]
MGDVDYYKRLTLEAKLIKQKYKTLGTGREGKLSKWSGCITVRNRPLNISIQIPEDFPNKPPLINANGVQTNLNEELDVLKNWRQEYNVTDVIDALRKYLEEKIDADKTISRRLAEELQGMRENSRLLMSGSEYVSIRVMRDNPSLREYRLMIVFQKYSKPRLNGKVINIKLKLPEEFPMAKPKIEISSGKEEIDLNLGNYLENLLPMRNWTPDKHLFEVALSILEFFNNFAMAVCPICLNKINAQEYDSAIKCRNPRCQSLYHKNCFEGWIKQGYKRECVFCDTPI